MGICARSILLNEFDHLITGIKNGLYTPPDIFVCCEMHYSNGFLEYKNSATFGHIQYGTNLEFA